MGRARPAAPALLPHRRAARAGGSTPRPITVGVVDELESHGDDHPITHRHGTPRRATATPATTPTATTDLVVTDFEWVAPTYASGGVRYVRASATVTNNTGDTLTEWSAAMTCFDAENDVRVASGRNLCLQPHRPRTWRVSPHSVHRLLPYGRPGRVLPGLPRRDLSDSRPRQRQRRRTFWSRATTGRRVHYPPPTR